MLESVITGIVSISLDNYVACLEAIHTMLFPTFLAGFCKIWELWFCLGRTKREWFLTCLSSSLIVAATGNVKMHLNAFAAWAFWAVTNQSTVSAVLWSALRISVGLYRYGALCTSMVSGTRYSYWQISPSVNIMNGKAFTIQNKALTATFFWFLNWV